MDYRTLYSEGVFTKRLLTAGDNTTPTASWIGKLLRFQAGYWPDRLFADVADNAVATVASNFLTKTDKA